MPETVESKPVKADASNDKIMAVIATIPLVGLIMFYAMKDASTLVKHYAKQSNALLAIEVVSMVISFVGSFIIIGPCIGGILSIVALVGWILLVIKAVNLDEKYVLPVIGDYFDKVLK